MTTPTNEQSIEQRARELLPSPVGYCRLRDHCTEIHVGTCMPPNRAGGLASAWAALYDQPAVVRAITAALRSAEQPSAPEAKAVTFDLIRHLHRQREFSERTFGPGARVKGVCDHLRRELIEVEEAPGDLSEWIDVVLLALDGAWRSGATPEQVAAALAAKQEKNERRRWPNWRTADPTKAIEHDRSSDLTIDQVAAIVIQTLASSDSVPCAPAQDSSGIEAGGFSDGGASASWDSGASCADFSSCSSSVDAGCSASDGGGSF